MIMTLNEVLVRQNFLVKILFKDGESQLDKALKVKLMGLRIALGKIRKQYDEDIQEAIKGFKPDGFDELSQLELRTDEEEEKLQELVKSINEDYNLFIIEKGNEEITLDKSLTFTEDEFEQILEVNTGNDVEINGNKLQAADFLEVIYSLFVAE